MDKVSQAICQTSKQESVDLPAPTFRNVVDRCHFTWDSAYSKFQRDIENINSDLVSDLRSIMAIQKTMVTIVQLFQGSSYIKPSNCLHSMICLEKRNRVTTFRINDLLKAVPEWSLVPQATHDNLSICATTLERQKIDLALMYLLDNPHNGLSDKTRVHWACLAIEKRQGLSKRLDAWKQRSAMTQEAYCHVTEASNRSTRQSSPGIMTPLEGWSEVGSETTETISEEPAPILFQELRNAARHTKDFTRYLQLLMSTNMRNEHIFAGLLGERCAEATECLHRRYSQLVDDLEKLLHIPRRGPSLQHVPLAPGSPFASQANTQAARSQSMDESHEDMALEAVFNEMGSDITSDDVAKLARHWLS